MPLRLNIEKRFSQRSDRVKGVDLHPTEPWLLANLYSGNVYIWNTNDQTLVKSFEVTELPVRTAKFVARKQWVVCGADDMYIRVYNYNTMDKLKHFEAHTDYIRSLAVHPTLPLLLSSSDDMLIKLWDWDKGWSCTQIFEGHSHYVMQVIFNPKDTNTFASASLDKTVKVWSIGQPTPNFTLEGHDKGVNAVDYFTGGDRPYLISGADDRTARVWDYQTKACVQTLEGHSHNVSACAFHPELPIIVTGSEDGTVRLWHSTTYRLENTLSYGLERLWSLGLTRGSNGLAMGFDEGCVMIKIGREEPVASMDASGKVIWARHNDIQTVNIKSLGAEQEADGERLPLAVKDLGSCDLYPQSLQHNGNGRFVAVCGDGEYIVYTALAWRNKSFGSALDVVWGDDSSTYAIRESSSTVKLFRNFKEASTLKLSGSAEGLTGGTLLGVRGTEAVTFFSWATGEVVRRIEVSVRDVKWSEAGELVAIVSDASFYVLQYDRDAVEAAAGTAQPEDGIEEAFDLLHEVPETVRTGLWVGDSFVYNNSAWRLNYCVGGEVSVMFHLDRPLYLLGYLASQSRVYLIDKEYGIVGYTMNLSMIEYKTLIIREELEAAAQLLPSIPKDQHNSVARFLEGRGMVAEALQVATDPDYRFELAVHLGKLDTALEIAQASGSEAKWRQLGELALAAGKLQVAQGCLEKAKDLAGLLLLHSASGSAQGMDALQALAGAEGKHNVEFLAAFLMGRLSQCVDILVTTNRLPEAAFFARTYLPSRISEVVQLWKKDLGKVNPKAAEALADPQQYSNLFPDMQLATQAEQYQASQAAKPRPASSYPQWAGSSHEDLIARMQAMGIAEQPEANGNHHQPGTSDADGMEEEAGTAGDSFGQVATASGAESLQPQPKSSEPEPESPALAAVDRNLELGLDAPAAKEEDPLDDGDDDDWAEGGEDLADEDLEAELGLDDDDDDDDDDLDEQH